MRYIITESALRKLLNSYFESEFEGSVLETTDYAGEEWTGVWKPNGTLIIGQPYDSESNTWFFNGKYFQDQWKVFNIDPSEFSNYMRDFLNKRYKGVINIDAIY